MERGNVAKRARKDPKKAGHEKRVHEEEGGVGDALLEGEHPYGVKPQGNLLHNHEDGAPMTNLLDVSLGRLRQLDDAGLLAVLARLSAVALCRMSTVSRGLYVFSHHSNLWRDLTINVYGGDFKYDGGWKNSYMRRMHRHNQDNFTPHIPLKMKKMYSDALYQPWMNSALIIDPSWLEVDNIERRSGLSPQQFVAQYETPGIPVILTDVMESWGAMREWEPERLRHKYGETQMRVSALMDMKVTDFLDYCHGSNDERPLYLFERNFTTKCVGMEEEYVIPPHFSEDLMGVLGDDRPDYRWLIMGPSKSGSSFHVDPNCNFAWNATVHGRKKWIMYPPHVTPPAVNDHVSLVEWFVKHYHEDHESKSKRLECVTRAGELMYVPRGWWHAVLNLEFSIALTHNVVTERNLLLVTDFLGDGSSCVGGEGCRADIAVNLSGDVPTSVIFPYKDKLGLGRQLRRERTSKHVCRCLGMRLGLLAHLQEALAKEKPGYLDRLEAEREKAKESTKSSWADLKLFPEHGQDHPASFAFGF